MKLVWAELINWMKYPMYGAWCWFLTILKLFYEDTSTVSPSGKQQYWTAVLLVLTCVFVSLSVSDATHPVCFSGSLLSAHLNVTLLAAGVAVTGDTCAAWPLCVPDCPTLIKRFSSSSSRARNEHEEGGDWTAVALQTEMKSIQFRGRENVSRLMLQ